MHSAVLTHLELRHIVRRSYAGQVANHGTVTKYRSCTAGPGGKPCQPCKDAAAAAKRRLRARKPSANTSAQGVKKFAANVVAMPNRGQAPETSAQPRPPGEVELATREQCDAATQRGDNQAGIKAAAIHLARLIDDPDFAAQAGGNIAKLQKLLAQLGPPKKKSKGRLQTISAMSGRKGVAS